MRPDGSARGTAALLFPTIITGLLVLPPFALGPLAFAMAQGFVLGSATIGLLMSAFFLASALCAGPGGLLTRRFATTGVARAGVLFSSGLCLAVAAAPSLPLIAAGCIVGGAVNGLVTPSLNIMITRVVPEHRRGLAFGLRVAAMPATYSVAALGAYVVAATGCYWGAVYVVWAAAGAAYAVLSRRLIDRPEGLRGRRRGTQRARCTPSLIILGAATLLGATGSSVLAPFLVVGLIGDDQAPSSAAALLALSSWVGIGMRICVGVYSDRSPDPLRDLRLTATMLATGSLGVLALALGAPGALLVAASVVAFGLGWSYPGLVQHATLTLHPLNPAAATSFVSTGSFLGAVIGPLVFGLVAEHASFALAWGGSAACMALAGALVLTAAMVLDLPDPAEL